MKRKDHFQKVIGSIERVRKAGEGPRESLFTFDEFECDLCKGAVRRKRLTQCAFCGRWICKENCWNEETMSCVSCAAVIKLGKETIKDTGEEVVVDEDEVDEEPAGEDEQGRGAMVKRTVKKIRDSIGDRKEEE